MKNNNDWLINLIVIIIAIFLIVQLSTPPETIFQKGKPILEGQGYTNVESTGYTFTCYHKGEESCGFTALNYKGEYVEGCFCYYYGEIHISF